MQLLLLTKFFTKGWGKPEHLKRIFEASITQTTCDVSRNSQMQIFATNVFLSLFEFMILHQSLEILIMLQLTSLLEQLHGR